MRPGWGEFNISSKKKNFPSTHAKTLKRVSRARAQPIIGWREYVSLPDLGVEQIKVKVDTGAQTSALHADKIEVFTKQIKGTKGELKFVRFILHPEQRSQAVEIECEAPLIGRRTVRSSCGQCSMRPVILTTLGLAGQLWQVEVTLVNRDVMGFRMLLGRQALKRRFSVDPGRSFLCGSIG